MWRVKFLRSLARGAALATTVISTAAALLTGPALTAAAAACPDVDFVFARGTGEPAGIGRVGQALVDALQSQMPGRTITTYGVNYPASYDFLMAQDGAVDAEQHVRSMAAQCPTTRIVLGGYSQGAAVVDMMLGIPPLGEKIGDIGSAAPLTADLAPFVSAIAVFGNPATKFGNPVTVAAAPFGGRGIDLCKDGDPICSKGRNPFAHKDYENSPYIPQAAGFIAGLL
jgi:cutinase